MRKATILMATAMLAAGSASYAADRQDASAAALAKATAGRSPGKPVDCLRLNEIRSSRIIDGTAILYEGANGTLYVNKPKSGASSLRSSLTLVTDTHSNRLCSVDIVRLVDVSSRMPVGSVGLGQFVPYPRPARSNAD